MWLSYAFGAAVDVLAAPFLPWPLALPALLLAATAFGLALRFFRARRRRV